MAFDDGAPLDAAKLGALETKLNNLEKSIPRFGSSKGNADNGSLESAAITQKQIISGLSSSVDLKPGEEVSIDITYNADSDPIAVQLTPVKFSGDLKKNQFSYYIKGQPTKSNTKVNILLNKSATSGFGIRFYYTVICG